MATDEFAKFKNQDNGVYYAFYEVEDSFLDTIVPEAAPYQKKDLNGDYVPITLREYLILTTPAVDDSGDVLMLLSAKQASCGRLTGTDGHSLSLWAHFLPMYGKPWENALTYDEAKVLLHSEKYAGTREVPPEEE